MTAYGVLLAPFLAVWQLRFLAPVTRYLDARGSGGVSAEQRHRAFASVMGYPALSALVVSGGWLVAVMLISGVLSLRWSDWGLFETRSC